jgi:hypothetical protein
MSGHSRFCFAFLLLAGLSTSSASSNPFTALFSAPEEATAPAPAKDAPAPAKEECLLRPGKSTGEGKHWVYRFDGHRKCWFQAEGVAAVKKPAHHHAGKQRVAAPKENEATPRQKAIVDARAELLRSATAETSQPTLPAPELKVVDAAPVAATGAAALVPPAPVVAQPVVAQPATDQLSPDHPKPRPVDVEMLLAAAPSARDTIASSVPPATPSALFIPDAGEDEWGATCLGVLLMALGLVSLLGSSRTLWRLDLKTSWRAQSNNQA